jgi:hypothetical protein
MADVIANSFKDYHVKGFDYLCLRRSPTLTTKLYFFDGDVSKLPEVVNPHDHRYDFRTLCLSGAVSNSRYLRDDAGDQFQVFQYRTPLNGGNGFEWLNETRLREVSRLAYGRGDTYGMRHAEIHTIRIGASNTVLLLDQYEDQVPLDGATLTFTKGNAPSLSGLYNRFTADDVRRRLRQLEDYAGISIPLRDEPSSAHRAS